MYVLLDATGFHLPNLRSSVLTFKVLSGLATSSTRIYVYQNKACGFFQQAQLRKLAQNIGQQVKTFTVEGVWNKLAS